MLNINPKSVAEILCNKLNINNDHISFGIFNILNVTNFNNYLSIKVSTHNIKMILHETEYSLGNTKILDLLAESMGYSSHRILKQKIPSKNQALPSRILCDMYGIEESDKDILLEIFDIILLYGAEGLLPHNLPENLLLRFSTSYDKYLVEKEETILSLLSPPVMLLYGHNNVKHGHFIIKTPEEGLLKYINIYGFSLLREKLRRMNILSIPDEYLPTVENFFDENRKSRVDFSKEIFEKY